MTPRPPRIIVAGVAAFAALAVWVLLRAYSARGEDPCGDRFRRARTAADSATVDSFVPGHASQLSCGFMRSAAWQGAPAGGQDSAAVHAIATGIVTADNARDIASVLGYYAEGAMLMPPGAAPVTGFAAIRDRYEDLFRSWQPAIEGRVDEVAVSGNVAWVRGHNGGMLRSLVPGTADRALDDVYLMTLRRQPGGGWEIARLMWHSQSPAQ